MIQQTQGIILKQLKYSESSIIVKIYTIDFGIQSYLVKGVRKKNQKNFAALFQPLSHIDLTSYSYKNNSLKVLKESKTFFHFENLHSDPIKITLSFFLSDLLHTTLKEEAPNPTLFHFIHQSLQILDNEKEQYANFHLWFMLQLTKFLGFYPNTDFISLPYFCLAEGNFVSTPSVESCSETDSKLIKKFLTFDIENSLSLKINKLKRQNVLDILIKYYNLHDYTITQLKSLKTLKEIFEIL